jgi:hypothetical protein
LAAAFGGTDGTIHDNTITDIGRIATNIQSRRRDRHPRFCRRFHHRHQRQPYYRAADRSAAIPILPTPPSQSSIPSMATSPATPSRRMTWRLVDGGTFTTPMSHAGNTYTSNTVNISFEPASASSSFVFIGSDGFDQIFGLDGADTITGLRGKRSSRWRRGERHLQVHDR